MSENEPPLPALSWQPVDGGCEPEFETYREDAYMSDLCLSTDATGYWHVAGRHRRYSHEVGGQTPSRSEAREEATRAAVAILANLPAGARSLKALRESDVSVQWHNDVMPDDDDERWNADLGPFALRMVASNDISDPSDLSSEWATWTWTIHSGATLIATGDAESGLAAFRDADVHLARAIEAAGLTDSGPHAAYYRVLCQAIRGAKLPLNVTARERASVADVIADAKRSAIAVEMSDDIPF
jgi:hypothetical protein